MALFQGQFLGEGLLGGPHTVLPSQAIRRLVFKGEEKEVGRETSTELPALRFGITRLTWLQAFG